MRRSGVYIGVYIIVVVLVHSIVSAQLSNIAVKQETHTTLHTIRIEPRFGDIRLSIGEAGANVSQRFIISEQHIKSGLHGNSTDVLIPSDTITITALRFYLSGITVNGNPIDTSRAHLIDATDTSTLRLDTQVLMKQSSAEQIIFQCRLGVDSAANTVGVLQGDLDPVRGMYWAWQSGYINFKLEGVSSRCTARKGKFQFHLGGYLPPHQSAQMLTFTLGKPLPKEQVLIFDVQHFLTGIDLAKLHTVMSPSPEAVRLSQKAAKAFRVQR